MTGLDPIDTRLLDEFQRGFPLDARPFARIGVDLGLNETDVIDRLSCLASAGAVARVGATVRPNTAGASTLAALAVPDGRIDEVGSPEELATTDGIYAELLALQGSTTKADKAKLLNLSIILRINFDAVFVFIQRLSIPYQAF